MYFEGKCEAIDLVPTLVKHINDATDSVGNKLWEMISSNVGVRNNTNQDDGWVFKSTGSSGEDNLIIGFANGWYHTTLSYHWLFGNMMFVASDYIPNEVEGQNGTFKGKMDDQMPVFYSEWNNYNEVNLPMRYYISITKDRVICAYYSDVIHSYSRTNLVYLGKPSWTAQPNDYGIVLGNGLSYTNNTNSVIRMTNPFMVPDYGIDSHDVQANLAEQARGWGGKVYPSRMVISEYSSGPFKGGQRGILDLLVVRQDGQFRKIDNLKIGDNEFLAVELPPYNNIYNGSNYNNNFCPKGNNGTHMYLFPKI